MKKVIYLLAFGLLACGSESSKTENKTPVVTEKESIEIYGNTQGTTYAIVVNDPIDLTKEEVDAIFSNFDLALSGYIDSSVVTKLNTAPAGDFYYRDTFNYFNRCYIESQAVYMLTGGSFDPTVYPLVDGWGFMKNIENVPDSATVESLRSLVSFVDGKHFQFYQAVDSLGQSNPSNRINKRTPGAKLDFNAIAQGLSVDIIAEEIQRRGGENYYIEIGGEIRVQGRNGDGIHWRIGIDKPIEHGTVEERKIIQIIELDDKSVATSGSYRKFYEKNGIKYSHTLDPKTGYPVKHALLSATVVADNCAFADAMATAFMVMGTEKTIEFVNQQANSKLAVFLIYTDEDGQLATYSSPDFDEMVVK